MQLARRVPSCEHVRLLMKLVASGDAAISKSLTLHGFMAFIIGGSDAEHRECQQCDDGGANTSEHQEDGCGANTSAPIDGSPLSFARGTSSGRLQQGFASLLERGEEVFVCGLRKSDGRTFEDLRATVVERASIRNPAFLLVNICYPDGSLQERSVPVEAVRIDGGRGRRKQSVVSSPEGADDASIVTEETAVEVNCFSDVPSVDAILRAKAATLKDWSNNCGGDLDSSLKKPLLILNLVAFWHPQEFSNVVERMHNLDKFMEEVASLSQGELFVTSPARSSKGQSTKEVSRKETINELRRIHAALKCSGGGLCTKYDEQRAAATERLRSLRLSADGEAGSYRLGASTSLSQLPMTPAERDEILNSMLLAERRGATPVQRLTTTQFAVLRNEATSAENSYSTPTGYSLVTMKVAAKEDAHQLTYHCTCAEYRNVSIVPAALNLCSTEEWTGMNRLLTPVAESLLISLMCSSSAQTPARMGGRSLLAGTRFCLCGNMVILSLICSSPPAEVLITSSLYLQAAVAYQTFKDARGQGDSLAAEARPDETTVDESAQVRPDDTI